MYMYVNYLCGCSTIDVHVRHTHIKNLNAYLENLYRGWITAYNILVLIKEKEKEI